MAAPRVVETVEILKDCPFFLTTCLPTVAPDQLCLEIFEECLIREIVVTIAFVAHRNLEAILVKASLALVLKVLRPAARMVNTALWPLPQSNGHIQGFDCQIQLHPVTDGPADDKMGVEVEDDC